MEVVASLFQGRTAAAQCGLFTHKSVPVIFEPPCILFFDLVLYVGFSCLPKAVIFCKIREFLFSQYLQVLSFIILYTKLHQIKRTPLFIAMLL